MERDVGDSHESSALVDGLRLCVSRRNINVDDGADPYFFDEDYTIAGSTGLARVWEGGWILVELLQTSLRAEVRRSLPWHSAPPIRHLRRLRANV
jgi:hypothetical protein